MKLLAAYFAFSFYVFGALLIENDVNYPTWYQLDAAHFGDYHRVLETQLQRFLFAPMGIHLLLNGLLIWQKPRYVYRGLVVSTFLLNGYVIAESLLIQVPIHQALTTHYSAGLINQLITCHRMWRLPAQILSASLTAWLLYRSLQSTQ